MNRPTPIRSPFTALLFAIAAQPLVAPPSLQGQQTPPGPRAPVVGDRVRVLWLDDQGEARRSQGRLMGNAGTELAIEGPNREVVVVPLGRIDSVEIRKGASPAAGGMLGAVIGFTLASRLAPDCGICIFDGKRAGIALAGGLVGTLIGYGLMNSHGWTEAPLPGGSIPDGPQPIIGVDRPGGSPSPSIRLGVRLPTGR